MLQNWKSVSLSRLDVSHRKGPERLLRAFLLTVWPSIYYNASMKTSLVFNLWVLGLGALLAGLPGAAQAQTAAPATSTDTASQNGWLEGTITNNDGHPVQDGYMGTVTGKTIKLTRHGGGAYSVLSDTTMGGFYSLHGLKPGIYDISVTTGYCGNTGSTPYRPQRILGVLISPGQRTLLNIFMPPGDTLQEAGQSAVIFTPATTVTEELTRMQKEIDDLKQQVAALTKTLATPVKP